MTKPQTFAEWWQSLLVDHVESTKESPQDLAQIAWMACLRNQPSFETLVAQLGELERENERLRVVLRALVDCQDFLKFR